MKNISLFLLLSVLVFSAAVSCGSSKEDEAYMAELLQSDIFAADPAVIRDCIGENGKTTLRWNVPKARKVEVHVGSAEGNLFTISGSEGSKETGYWVRDGMKFVLVDGDSGEELAIISVKVLCGK